MYDSRPEQKPGKGFLKSRLLDGLDKVPERTITIMLVAALVLGILTLIDAA